MACSALLVLLACVSPLPITQHFNIADAVLQCSENVSENSTECVKNWGKFNSLRPTHFWNCTALSTSFVFMCLCLHKHLSANFSEGNAEQLAGNRECLFLAHCSYFTSPTLVTGVCFTLPVAVMLYGCVQFFCNWVCTVLNAVQLYQPIEQVYHMVGVAHVTVLVLMSQLGTNLLIHRCLLTKARIIVVGMYDFIPPPPPPPTNKIKK